MHIKKYDVDYWRRKFMADSFKGAASAGVLTGLWPLLSQSTTLDATKAYPDELLSIEVHTKGKVKPGDIITKDNVEHVAHLLDPVALHEVKNMGRKIKIKEATTDVSKLFPSHFLEATLRNQGLATFDDAGNIRTKDGKAWLGGLPFPDAQNAIEGYANLVLSWGRHNYFQFSGMEWDLSSEGDVQYQYEFVWSELQVSARPDGTVWQDRDDLLRYNTFLFVTPNEQAGTSFLNTWYYDQRKFPDLVGYLPAFKRVREFPTSQRFEPLAPGLTYFLSDTWAAGDPMLTWGNFKLVGRQPMLGTVSGWYGSEHSNWGPLPTSGGPKDDHFWVMEKELIPEVLVVECEPSGYPRSPVGKKRVWIDVRNQMFIAYVTYDRKGQLWKSWELGYSQYKDGNTVRKYKDGTPVWSWTHGMSHDIQTNRISRFFQAKEITGGHKSQTEEEGGITSDQAYDRYLTTSALRRFGS